MKCEMITDIFLSKILISFGAPRGVFPPACCAYASTLQWQKESESVFVIL